MSNLLISKKLNISPSKINSAVQLLDEGNTIPFIARYRKEATGNLDEVQLRDIQEWLEFYRELQERKQFILQSIESQGKLTAELKSKIEQTQEKQVLEDLYLPYKPKRQTRATKAKDRGLEPLSELILNQQPFQDWIKAYLESEQGKEMTEDLAIEGAKDILAEKISMDTDLLSELRQIVWEEGWITSEVKPEFEKQKTKYNDYYQFEEAIPKSPAHRLLAIRRGEKEKILRMGFKLPEEKILQILSTKWIPSDHLYQEILTSIVGDSYKRLIEPTLELYLRTTMKNKAEKESILVFSENLKNLLMAPYGGSKMTLGIDPGYRTGCKWAVIDPSGKLISKGVIYLVGSEEKKLSAYSSIFAICKQHEIEVVCVGNGTASKETFQFVKKLLNENELKNIHLLMVNEAGASVYSASDCARIEFPDLDLTERSAISIARRFQDPLAELVKIDPKSIGVGQYQHDVNQTTLKKSLSETVESCVNQVGVNVNTASAELLSYVSGLNKKQAKALIDMRYKLGAFENREKLKQIPGLGEKTFQQAVGFLRVPNSNNPLDATAVHPESYYIVENIAKDLNVEMGQLVSNAQIIQNIDKQKYASEIGNFTLEDILEELKRPGRDPRSEFVPVQFEDTISDIQDLKVGMKLEGVITNVTKFGAFVDIGVHRDGFIHISEVANFYVDEIEKHCKVNQKVQVRVLEVDLDRQRIKLSMKDESPSKKPSQKKAKKNFSLEDLQRKFQ